MASKKREIEGRIRATYTTITKLFPKVVGKIFEVALNYSPLTLVDLLKRGEAEYIARLDSEIYELLSKRFGFKKEEIGKNILYTVTSKITGEFDSKLLEEYLSALEQKDVEKLVSIYKERPDLIANAYLLLRDLALDYIKEIAGIPSTKNALYPKFKNKIKELMVAEKGMNMQNMS